MINLVMVLHGHQPVGNFDHVFEMAFNKCYRPVLQILEKHPVIRVGMHFSGPLFEWMDKKDPECLDVLKTMVKRKQVELLSGGFFEPLLASIPEKDARGQVRMMNDYIDRNFGVHPNGFWLTERVWDPRLPATLEGTGMRYTIVDDTHLYYSGIDAEDIYGYYITEKEGHVLNIMATPMTMRYIIPFRLVDDVISHLKTLDESGRKLAVYGDDTEKFGLWPGTYEWVIQKGWLDRFFSAISDNGQWLKTVLPGEAISSDAPLGRIYLPQASYEEMTEWALPPEAGARLEEIITQLKNDGRWDPWRPFIRGGTWDNFLTKYDESNFMHKKMLFLSERLPADNDLRIDLWRSQCNCAYWHGIFGGLYLGHLRRAIHENLIKSQKIFLGEAKTPMLLEFDLDKDGNDEILLWDHDLGFCLSPARGGGLFDLCSMPAGLNLSDTLTRRQEAYHLKVRDAQASEKDKKDGIASIHDLSHQKDTDLERFLIRDGYTRISLLDHFLGPDATLEKYQAADYPEEGDFIKKKYVLERKNTAQGNAMVELSANGGVNGKPLKITKRIVKTDGAQLAIDYCFECGGQESITSRFGSEFNLTLYSHMDGKRYLLFKEKGKKIEGSETGEENDVKLFEFINGADGVNVSFSFSIPVTVWFYPLMTVSQSEGGFEKSYQGTSLLFILPFSIAPGQRLDFNVMIKILF
ncbi:MAG: DUF1926 domain-containing protein [Deltaproteobacteria bacterium]|nr:DUF1926 domain-containing protein [Deltaproteobacteria bacterium]